MTDSGPMFSGITTFVDNSGFTFGVGGGTSIFTPATNVLTFGTNSFNRAGIKCTNAATYDGSLEFFTGNSSNFSERMRIHASGEISAIGTTQPSFLAYRTSNQSGYNASGAYGTGVAFDGTIYNNGSDFNTSNGRFTAPVAGTYLFQGSVYTDTQGFTQAWLAINGSRANYSDMMFQMNVGNLSAFIATTHIAKLDAGDYVMYNPYNPNSSNVTVYGNPNHTFFKGVLLW